MSASRVETESKTAAPRWETEGDDYKADLSKYPEEIKDLCPIVITTCDCRPTKFKADGKELSLKDKAGKLLELTDIGVEMVAKSSAEGRNEFKKDGKRVEAMDFEFDKNIKGDENNDDAHFLVDVSVDKKEGRSYNVFEGRDIVGGGIATQIDKVAKERGATHCMLYVHGFMCQPQVQIQAAMEVNAKWEGKGAFCIPVVWPAEPLAYWTQKKGANGAALGLKNSILPFLKHKIDEDCRDEDGKLCDGTKVSISIMCHSMGNYVLKKMAPETESAFQFDNIFMVASDVRATTFDLKKGYCKVKDGKGKPDYDHDGEDIMRLAKHKVHVCWYGSDLALLGRRAMPNSNYGRAALGRNGLNSKYNRKLIETLDSDDPKGKLCDKNCAEWNKQIASSFGRLLGHSYQTEKEALKYYLDNMREHCDHPEDKP